MIGQLISSMNCWLKIRFKDQKWKQEAALRRFSGFWYSLQLWPKWNRQLRFWLHGQVCGKQPDDFLKWNALIERNYSLFSMDCEFLCHSKNAGNLWICFVCITLKGWSVVNGLGSFFCLIIIGSLYSMLNGLC